MLHILLWGMTPPRNYQERGTLLLCLLRQPGKTWRSLVYFAVVLCFGFSFLSACPWVVTQTALQTAGVFLSVFTTYRVFRTVQEALQTATAVRS